jgi:hypothetical protein
MMQLRGTLAALAQSHRALYGWAAISQTALLRISRSDEAGTRVIADRRPPLACLRESAASRPGVNFAPLRRIT